MSKNGDLEWPPRSPDLTVPDYFLWGYLKSKVYASKPKTIDELKCNIRAEIAAIETSKLACDTGGDFTNYTKWPLLRTNFNVVIRSN